MDKFTGRRSSTFETVSLHATSRLNVIIVHGLRNQFTSHAKDLRKRLRNLKHLESINDASIHIFDFDVAALLQKGDRRFDKLVKRLQGDIVHLLEKDSRRTFILVAHNLAGFVVQRAVASFTPFTTSAQFDSIIGVIFWNLPDLETKNKWEDFSDRIPLKRRKLSKPSVKLHFDVIGDTTNSFDKLLRSQSAQPEIESFNLFISPDPQRISLLRRATSKLIGSSRSSTQTSFEALSLPLVDDKAIDELVEKIQALIKRRASSKRVSPPVPRVTNHGEKATKRYSDQKSVDKFDTPMNQTPTRRSLEPEETKRPGSTQTTNERQTQLSTAEDTVLVKPPHEETAELMQTIGHIPKVSGSPESLLPSINQPHTILTDERLHEMARHAIKHARRENFRQAISMFAEINAQLEIGVQDGERGVRRRTTMPSSFLLPLDVEVAIIKLKEGVLRDAVSDLERLERLASKHHWDPRETWHVCRWLSITYDALGEYQKAARQLIKVREMFDREVSYPNISKEKRTLADRTRLSTTSMLSLIKAKDGDLEQALKMSEKINAHKMIKGTRNAQEEGRDKLRTLEEKISSGRQQALRLSKSVSNEAQQEANISEQKNAMNQHVEISSTLMEHALYLREIDYNRAVVLWLGGHLTEAMELNRKVTRESKMLLGTKHTETIQSRILQAEILLAILSIQDAEDTCLELLEDIRVGHGKITNGEPHLLALSTYKVQVAVYITQGRLTEARNAAKYLTAQSERLLETKSRQSICARSLLAVVHAARGDFVESIPVQKQVIKDAIERFGPAHPFTVESQVQVAKDLYHLGNIKAAEKWCWAVIDNLSPLNLVASDTIVRQGEELRNTPGFLAKLIGKNLIKANEKLLDTSPYQSCYYQVLQCIGNCERERINGDPGIAMKILESVLYHRSRNSYSGQWYVETLVCMHELAVTHRKMGNWQAALEQLDKALKGREEVLGDGHQHTLITRFERNLVKFLGGDEVYLEEQRDILDQLDQLLGKTHVDVVNAHADFVYMLSAKGYLEEAVDIQLQVLWQYFSMTSQAESNLTALLSASGIKLDAVDDGSLPLANAIIQILDVVVSDDIALKALEPDMRVFSGITKLAEITWDLGDHDDFATTQMTVLRLAKQWGFTDNVILSKFYDLGHMYQTHADICNDVGCRRRKYLEAKILFERIIETVKSDSAAVYQQLLKESRHSLGLTETALRAIAPEQDLEKGGSVQRAGAQTSGPPEPKSIQPSSQSSPQTDSGQWSPSRKDSARMSDGSRPTTRFGTERGKRGTVDL